MPGHFQYIYILASRFPLSHHHNRCTKESHGLLVRGILGTKVKLIFLLYGFASESPLPSEITISKGSPAFNRFYVDLKLRGLKKWWDEKIHKKRERYWSTWTSWCDVCDLALRAACLIRPQRERSILSLRCDEHYFIICYVGLSPTLEPAYTFVGTTQRYGTLLAHFNKA